MSTIQSINVTLTNLTSEQYAAIQNILAGLGNDTGETKTKRSRKSAPENTVSEEEEESFGKRALKAADLEDEDEEEATDSDDEDEEEKESTVEFDDLVEKINLYGEQKPKDMLAILSAFNTDKKRLKKQPQIWEAIYRKVNSKLKALK